MKFSQVTSVHVSAMYTLTSLLMQIITFVKDWLDQNPYWAVKDLDSKNK